MKIMDCTLRDGANVVGNGFPADLTAMMLKGLVENGVSIIEYGNAKGLGAEEVGFPSPVTDKEYLEMAQPYMDKAEIGMFLNAKRYKKENVKYAATRGLTFLRVGADAGDGSKYYEVIDAVKAYIEGNAGSEIVEWLQSAEAKFKSGGMDIYLMPAATDNLSSCYTLYEVMPGTSVYVSQTAGTAIKVLGGSDAVSGISIYANDFDNKEQLLSYLDEWNTWCEEGGSYNGVTLTEGDKITYTDTVGMLMGIMQTMIDIITYVLVAFTAISLVVSSVMIGIITYVSVVERVKEIGVLRALGARKQDVRNLFNAETFIIGLAAGLIGIGIAYALSAVISMILQNLTGIAGIASLPVTSAIVMVCVSVVLTLISGLIPAQSAAKKDPVIALRTE